MRRWIQALSAKIKGWWASELYAFVWVGVETPGWSSDHFMFSFMLWLVCTNSFSGSKTSKNYILEKGSDPAL